MRVLRAVLPADVAMVAWIVSDELEDTDRHQEGALSTYPEAIRPRVQSDSRQDWSHHDCCDPWIVHQIGHNCSATPDRSYRG